VGLVLTITNAESLDNGVSTRLSLDRHGAVIGRSPSADWSLPDESRFISSTHCEIDYRGGAYLVIDKSVNGTFINGAAERVTSPHALADGDVLVIGHYEIRARLSGAAAPRPIAPESQGDIWGAHSGQPPAPTHAPDWIKPAARPEIHGGGAMSGHFAAPPVTAPAPDPIWGVEPPPPARPASDWSSETAGTPPAADDIWGRFAAVNTVDWGRGGFDAGAPPASAPEVLHLHGGGAPVQAAEDIFGLSPSAPPVSAAPTAPAPAPRPAPATQPRARTQPPAPAAPAAAPAPVAAPSPDAALRTLLEAAGLSAEDARAPAADTLASAGMLLARLTAGIVVMMEARARAKAQLGASGTMLELNGNNPLKFARTPDRALAQLLNPAERGFMPADQAVEDAFKDLQAHQMATLAAMQGALAATLARFSPQAIRDRAETGGVLASIMPNAKNAALWKAYEREFEGVARGSDEAFMDVFAKEFRSAYERAAGEMRGRR
jgi:type VI secretion system FHA domain protein